MNRIKFAKTIKKASDTEILEIINSDSMKNRELEQTIFENYEVGRPVAQSVIEEQSFLSKRIEICKKELAKRKLVRENEIEDLFN